MNWKFSFIACRNGCWDVTHTMIQFLYFMFLLVCVNISTADTLNFNVSKVFFSIVN